MRRTLERDLATRLSPVSRAWQQLADEVLAELRVSNSSGWCLIYLDRLGPAVKQGDLARQIGVTQPSLVRTLQQLEAQGLVERRSDAGDRRINHVSLTDSGATMAARIEHRLQALRIELLADAPSEDIAATLRVCDVLSREIAARRQQP
ncbi:MarR family winged helix-turn-helix transcriptional regulator [Sphingomonas sanxanigenens]|uniref:HTH marR-type domain-containing protein n=1 Tax=Sphingomonas sanxanigenens DSM 19645 = NX02 TaxID=1123269 RepID=W0AIY4_9SPHN|nr:MarR family transcriptional regulator [Sphingomonas sanxanigenens]AHE56497.1 hypothetical protein NX02_24450 [Sphingomonas sanxanigenens DSM 19645 = NX02]